MKFMFNSARTANEFVLNTTVKAALLPVYRFGSIKGVPLNFSLHKDTKSSMQIANVMKLNGNSEPEENTVLTLITSILFHYKKSFKSTTNRSLSISRDIT